MSMVGGAFLTSCGDNFLDTKSPSSLDDKNIFSIYDLAKGTVYNIYTYYGEQNYRARFTSYYGMNTDVEWFNGSDKGDDKANMATYNVLPGNGQLNIADANMLNKLSPFFAVIFSAIVLRERAKKRDLAAVCAAFIGALFVIKPSFHMSFVPALIGAAGGLGAGIAYVFVRLLGKKGERGSVIVFFFSLFSTIMLAPVIIFHYTPMTLKQWIILIFAGIAAMGGQLNITAAYTYAPAKDISVFDYSQILFAALLGFLFLHQLPDVYSLIGYVIIIGAAVFRWMHRD